MYLNALQEKISCNVDMFILKHTFCHVVFVFVLECNIERDQVQRRHILKYTSLHCVFVLYLNVLGAVHILRNT